MIGRCWATSVVVEASKGRGVATGHMAVQIQSAVREGILDDALSLANPAEELGFDVQQCRRPTKGFYSYSFVEERDCGISAKFCVEATQNFSQTLQHFAQTNAWNVACMTSYPTVQ